MATELLSIPDSDALFEGAPCGLIVTTEDGTILRSNRMFISWIGFSESELTGRRFQELLTMGGRIFHQTHWAPLMQMQGSVAEVKLDLKHREGHTVTVLLNGVRREHGSGAIYELALFGTADRDRYEKELLSARKLAEELLWEKTAAETALQQAQAELNTAYKTAQRRALFAEQMVAIASHDLKNPLTAIKMAAEMLTRVERTPKENQLLSHINHSSERAQRMIADLLDLAMARVGHGISVTRRPADLENVVDRSISELRVTFPQATLIHHSSASGTVDLDADRLQQLIGNLVANSVTYGDLRHPITITSTLDAGVVCLSVHNEGSAIPEPLLATLFEPMTRGSERENDVRSVGLGLFIVREIARAHGGDAVVNSTQVNGTTFTVMLAIS